MSDPTPTPEPQPANQCQLHSDQLNTMQGDIKTVLGLLTGDIRHPDKPGILERIRSMEKFRLLVITVSTSAPVIGGAVYILRYFLTGEPPEPSP